MSWMWKIIVLLRIFKSYRQVEDSAVRLGSEKIRLNKVESYV